MDNAVTTTTTIASAFVSQRALEIELEWGGNVTVEVAIGAVTTLSDPESQISSDCALSDLPEVGTSFQRIKVSLKSNSSRDIEHPKVLLGSLGKTENSANPEGEFFTIGPSDDRTILPGGTPAANECVLNEDVDFAQGPNDIGFFQELMNPGEIESFQTILSVKPGDPTNWQWALLVTSREDEADFYGIVNPDGLSPGALIIGLHDFGGEELPDLVSGDKSENLVERICSALSVLKAPIDEAPDSENLMALERWYELNDSDLAGNVNQVIRYYKENPNSASTPFSLWFAMDRCQDLGN